MRGVRHKSPMAALRMSSRRAGHLTIVAADERGLDGAGGVGALFGPLAAELCLDPSSLKRSILDKSVADEIA